MHFSRHVLLCFMTLSFPLFPAAAETVQALLPKPDGAFEVGIGTAELIDDSRTQPFAPDVELRKLMISLFYPVNSHKTTAVNYLPPTTAAFEDKFQQTQFGLASPNGTFESLALQLASRSAKTHDTPNFPIVLFSPAQGTSRLFYNVIAQTIASRGYMVVTIDAPYDVDFVEFADGSVAPFNATVAANITPEDIDIALTARTQDVSFVLDQLGNATVVSELIPGCRNSLNVRKVAMFGHSLGGAATAAAALNDHRIAGGVAMDGALFGPVVEQGLDKPFMLMADKDRSRSDDNNPEDPDNSWFKIWPKLRAFKADVMLANSLHYTFSDFPILLNTLGVVPNATVAEALQVTDLSGARALKIVTTYVTAFLDMVLKGKYSHLLNGPVAAFPEVTFER